jgi:hypothetical protein
MLNNSVNLLDDLDIFLLKEIWERDTTGTRILAKDYFFKDANLEREKGLYQKIDAKDMLINLRLKRMGKLGLVSVIRKKSDIGRERNEYLLTKNIVIKKYKFPNRISKAILLRIDNRWHIFEIDKTD